MAVVTAEIAPLLARGQMALADGRWAEAADAFGRALGVHEDRDATFGLAIARWWLGENSLAIRGWERAYVLYRRHGQVPAAVMAGFYLCLAYQMTFGNTAAARGWLGRSARAAAGPGGEGTAGWIALARSHLAMDDGRPGEAEGWAREAVSAAAASGDVDLELCAASELGAALLDLGRTEEGGALLDEAMAGAIGGEGRDLDTVVLISCRTITAASRGGDLRRVIQWVTAADAFYRRFGSPHLYATCRAQYGAILFATGRWQDAERELEHALRLADGAEASVRSQAIATLAELRVAQGRLGEAGRLLAGQEAHPPATVPLALHHLAEGRARAAATLLRRRLRHLEPGTIGAARLLELLVQSEVAAGRIEAADEIAATVRSTSAATGSPIVEGRASQSAGIVALARGDPQRRPQHSTSRSTPSVGRVCRWMRRWPGFASPKHWPHSIERARSRTHGRRSRRSTALAPCGPRTPPRRSSDRWAFVRHGPSPRRRAFSRGGSSRFSRC